MTAAGRQAHGSMSIGAVLDQLRADFPDVTISKIRFLEAEGLITPERTPAGYRRFSVADCERLRFVLTAQRDHYLPLKVIKEQLDAIDRGQAPSGPGAPGGAVGKLPRALGLAASTGSSSTEWSSTGSSSTGSSTTHSSTATSSTVSAEEFRTDRQVRISRGDLLARSGVDEKLLAELLRNGIIAAGAAGFFDIDALTVARAAKAMAEYGVEPRHLRAFKTAADREAGLIAQIAGPVAKSRAAGARDRAEELVRELAALSVTLHTSLVKAAVRDSFDH